MPDSVEKQMTRYVNALPPDQKEAFYAEWNERRRDRNVALLLSLSMGGVALDRFYLDQYLEGVKKLGLNVLTLGGWSLVDLFRIVDATDRQNLALLRELQARYPGSSGAVRRT